MSPRTNTNRSTPKESKTSTPSRFSASTAEPTPADQKRIQGYKRLGPFVIECNACKGHTTPALRARHEKSLAHLAVLGLCIIPGCTGTKLEGRKYCAAHQERANGQTLAEKVTEQRAAALACATCFNSGFDSCHCAQAQESKTWTPPNAEPFLWLQENEETATADCGCTLDPVPADMEGAGAAFFMCETHEAAEETKRRLSAVTEHLGTLADFLREAHEEEIQNEHDGDGSLGCSYCDAINEADRLQRAGIGLPDRNWAPWQLAEDDTPQAGRWILVDGNNHDDEHPTNQTLETEEDAKALADHFNN